MLISAEHKVHLYNLSSILVINLQTYYLYILACAKNEHCYQLNQHNEPYAQVQWWRSVIIHLPVFPGVQLLVYYLHYFHFRRLSSSIPPLLLWSNHLLACFLKANQPPLCVIYVAMLLCHFPFQNLIRATHLLHISHPSHSSACIFRGSCPKSYRPVDSLLPSQVIRV